MSARRLSILVSLLAIALATAAIACDSGAPEAGPAPVDTRQPTAAAPAAPTVDSAQQAAWDEQARADLADDVRRRVAAAHAVYGDGVPVRVESGLFVLVGAEPGVPFDAAADLAQRALDEYLGSFFDRRPDRAVTVYVVRSPSGFAKLCNSHFSPTDCAGDLGAYSRETRTILANVGPGLPTITHELVHPLVQTDFPLAAPWLDEGIASLFENPVFSPTGEIHGAKNWRYESIATALASPVKRVKLHLKALFALGGEALDGEDRNLEYSVARFFCQWLDERAELWPFYRAWRDGIATDPTGAASFEKVTGMSPEQADAAWMEWVKGLR